MKKSLIFLIVLGFVAGPFTAAFAAETKFAYVDVAKVFDDYQKTKDNDQTLQSEGKKKETERDALVVEIRQMKDEMALLTEDAKGKKQEQMEAKIQTLQAFDQQTRKNLGEQRNKVVKEIFKDIDDAVQRYGERNGVDMVFNERALLFKNSKLDITQPITEELNKNYAAKRS